jgi:hypothetical protein
MTSATLTFDDIQQPRTARKLARFLSPKPVFKLHSRIGTERKQLEAYIYEQFHSAHNASIKDFMPQLFSIKCNGRFSAAAGVRPGSQQDFFLEQYLPERVEKIIGDLKGETIERRKIAEIGNMVATQRGSSQLLFLIFYAVLQQSKHEWIVFTATPTVLKGIRQLGFNLHTLGEASLNALDSSAQDNWGTYYEDRPQIVAGNLAEAMELMSGRKIYSSLLSLFKGRITELAKAIDYANA